ncbi:hypothetical protein TNCV_1353561 [Trichonephila clavipes]|nr:hypothetical protein TNCV_1353561 [Trichonephila clavipes]
MSESIDGDCWDAVLLLSLPTQLRASLGRYGNSPLPGCCVPAIQVRQALILGKEQYVRWKVNFSCSLYFPSTFRRDEKEKQTIHWNWLMLKD